MSEEPETTKQPESSEPWEIASALLYHDRFWVPWLMLFLGVPAALETFLLQMPRELYLSGIVLERVSQLLVLFGVTFRWRRRLEQSGARGIHMGAAFVRTCIFGFALWSLWMIPLQVATLWPESPLLVPAALLLVIGLVWSLRYYFYFSAIGLIGLSLRQAAVRAYDMSKRAPRAAWHSVLAPLGITFLMVNACNAVYPDGRSIGWSAVGAFFESTFWLLSTYTALAFSLVLVSDSDWRAAGLDPYRAERLQTLRVQRRQLVADMLAPRSGMQALCLAVLLFVSNAVRDFNEPPAAAIRLQNVSFEDNLIRVSVQVEDPIYDFRGFLPVWFSVATHAGAPISQKLVALTDDRASGQEPGTTPAHVGPVVISLDFSVSRTADALRGMDDLWLWYENTPIEALSKARTPEAGQVVSQPVPPG